MEKKKGGDEMPFSSEWGPPSDFSVLSVFSALS
jgi:hypothetical protein